MTASRVAPLGLPGWLIVIAVMTAIGPVSIDLYLPAFTMIESEFQQRGAERTMASYLVGLAIGQLFYGPISDRFGRKPPLYFGFIVYTVGAAGCALSTDMTMLMVCRVVQAMGACSGMAIGRAIVRDRCEPEQAARAFSTLMMIVSIAPILAPVAGGMLVSVMSWRVVFVVQAALGIGLLIAMHFALTESLQPELKRPLHLGGSLRTYLRLLRDRAFLGYALLGGFAMASLFCYVAGAPTVLTRTYQLSPQHFGWLIGLNGIAFMIASRLNLRALHLYKPADILARFVWVPSIFGLALVLAGLFGPWPLPVVIAMQFCFFITVARVMPNTSALALAPYSRDAGSASALLGALQSLAAMLTGAAMAIFNNDTLLPLALIMTSSVVVAGLLHRYATRRPEALP
ncbi:MAG TPA: multidrug effflux MFS transporter [Steroidobacteraceae bacterium]|nr:multidrug effflux MFS transporter [Steroidobacteraceae bacterium]